MSSREIVLWLDERWYQALSSRLKDESVEDKLNGYLDELINQLPERVYKKISGEIWEERQRLEQEIEAEKRYSAFRGCRLGCQALAAADGGSSFPGVPPWQGEYHRRRI